jgi:hypothetical protein
MHLFRERGACSPRGQLETKQQCPLRRGRAPARSAHFRLHRVGRSQFVARFASRKASSLLLLMVVDR